MTLKRTPLFDQHRKLGAKLVEFAGWAMPLQYTSILEEHKAVREGVGVFDVSHMGRLWLKGPQALDLLERLLPNDVSRLDVDQALYSPMCHEGGGTLDDLIVYRLPDGYLVVVNAANTQRDLEWMRKHAVHFDVELRDVTAEWAQLAVQGPKAEAALQKHVGANLAGVRYYRGVRTAYAGQPVLLTRTGYTGEDGFEVYGPPEAITQLWDELIRSGITPAGLGARDSLRFEASYPLYGHELDEQTTPVEAGLGWTVKEKPVDYIGKAVLLRQKRGEGVRKRLIGFRMREPGVPRQGYKLFLNGEAAGYVTSGMKAPTLGAFLGMGYVRGAEAPPPGTPLQVEIHAKRREAEVVKLPFYRGSLRT